VVDFTMVYTAVYFPCEERVDDLWPGETGAQRFNHFMAAEYTQDDGQLPS
jgi:hypothetical protein